MSFTTNSNSLYRTAVETLLSVGFEPERSIVLAMGIDEEHGGAYVGLFYIPKHRFTSSRSHREQQQSGTIF